MVARMFPDGGALRHHSNDHLVATRDSLLHFHGCSWRFASHIVDRPRTSLSAVTRSCDGTRAVLRKTICLSEGEVAAARFEADVLRKLQPSGVPCLSTRCDLAEPRLPALLALDVEEAPMSAGGESAMHVQVAMTHVPGATLEDFLAERTVPPERAPFQLEDACRFASELLTQIGFLLDKMAGIAYHRDVGARNVLVQAGEVGRPIFGLAGFSQAVDELSWHLGEDADVLAGDGRYWPVSAWRVFESGASSLAQDRALCREHRTCLDVHALGLTALRCFVEMLPHQLTRRAPSSDAYATRIKVEAVRAAWEQYWARATRYWRHVERTLREQGDLSTLRRSYANVGVHDVVFRADLEALGDALREARAACLQTAPPGLESAPAVFAAIFTAIGCDLDANPLRTPQGLLKLIRNYQSDMSFCNPCSKSQASTASPASLRSLRSPGSSDSPGSPDSAVGSSTSSPDAESPRSMQVPRLQWLGGERARTSSTGSCESLLSFSLSSASSPRSPVSMLSDQQEKDMLLKMVPLL